MNQESQSELATGIGLGSSTARERYDPCGAYFTEASNKEIPMPTVKVSLNEDTWTVQVDTDPIDIPAEANPQSIHWHLSGNAYAGKFKSLTGSPPGFAWSDDEPPDGIFDPPTLSTKKKALTLIDKNPPPSPGKSNRSKSSYGEWAYSLSIVVGGETYSTAPITVSGKDPIIKNN